VGLELPYTLCVGDEAWSEAEETVGLRRLNAAAVWWGEMWVVEVS
jgi:hypothetical protein